MQFSALHFLERCSGFFYFLFFLHAAQCGVDSIDKWNCIKFAGKMHLWCVFLQNRHLLATSTLPVKHRWRNANSARKHNPKMPQLHRREPSLRQNKALCMVTNLNPQSLGRHWWGLHYTQRSHPNGIACTGMTQSNKNAPKVQCPLWTRSRVQRLDHLHYPPDLLKVVAGLGHSYDQLLVDCITRMYGG